MGGRRDRAARILDDWANVRPRADESASVQQRIVGDVTGMAHDVLALEAALERLARVGGEFSANMAGPWWDELCGALSQARAELRR